MGGCIQYPVVMPCPHPLCFELMAFWSFINIEHPPPTALRVESSFSRAPPLFSRSAPARQVRSTSLFFHVLTVAVMFISSPSP
jgi:hypothetical protein